MTLSSSEVEAVLRLPRAEKEKLLPDIEAWARARAAKAEEARRAGFAASIAQVRARCATLAGFVREAWPVLEPNTPLVWNWHLDALCMHLEAVSNGQITRLLINIPPGSSKSMIVSVMWQAWEWGPRGLPSMRFLTTSFNDGPVKRDTRKTRDLIASEWFRSLWPDVTLTRTGETSFANGLTGTREGVAFGSLTSQRGDRLIIDDPHSTQTAESDVERARTVRQFQEGAINRLNDQTKSAIVVVMQRLHEDDVAGVILKSKMGFEHLCLPMEFEPDRRCRTSIGFVDPRTYDGELLDPIRFPREVIERDFKVFAYSWAGQYQQRPAPREGGLFKRHWFQIVDAIPVEATKRVRSWDIGATKGGGDPTVGLKARRVPDGVFYIENVVREQFGPAEVEQLIKATASQDGTACPITIPEDPGAAGKAYAETLVGKLAGYPVKRIRPTGDKQTRATPAAAQAEAGNIKLLRGPWNEAFLDEICTFPAGAHDDQVDALADAVNELALAPPPVRVAPLRM